MLRNLSSAVASRFGLPDEGRALARCVGILRKDREDKLTSRGKTRKVQVFWGGPVPARSMHLSPHWHGSCSYFLSFDSVSLLWTSGGKCEQTDCTASWIVCEPQGIGPTCSTCSRPWLWRFGAHLSISKGWLSAMLYVFSQSGAHAWCLQANSGSNERLTPSLENRALRLYFPEDYSMIEAAETSKNLGDFLAEMPLLQYTNLQQFSNVRMVTDTRGSSCIACPLCVSGMDEWRRWASESDTSKMPPRGAKGIGCWLWCQGFGNMQGGKRLKSDYCSHGPSFSLCLWKLCVQRERRDR